MKTIAIISLLAASAGGAYAQGTINFFNDFSGKIVTHIYAPNPSNPNVETTGNSSIDTPAGSQNYTGYTAIGGSSGAAGGAINYANGNNFSVGIYALGEDAPSGYSGTSTPFSSLMPVTQYSSILSPSSSLSPGFFQLNNPAGDPGIPNTGYNSSTGNADNVAAVSLVAWYNDGGTITSFAQAQTTTGIPYGNSTVFVLSDLGEPSSIEEEAYGLPGTPPGDMVSGGAPGHYLTSESLNANSAPEPGTIALGVVGVCGFLARRRKK
jgi:hypothetical protein